MNETSTESVRNVSISCPVQCSKPSPNAFCVKPVNDAFCGNPEEECCLENESSIDSMTKDLIKLVQQTVAKNESKNIGAELSALASSTASTTPAMPSCDGTCVVSLFSILCDEIDSTQYCPNGGSCCVNREPTTAVPAIGPCQGTCIPVILSGMCNKPYELVLKTTDCASSTICCADKKVDSSDDSNGAESSIDAFNDADKGPASQTQLTPRPIIRHPPSATPQLLPNQFNYQPSSFLVNSKPVPMPPLHPKPKPPYGLRNRPSGIPLHVNPVQGQTPNQMYMVTDQSNSNNNVHMRPHLENAENSKPIEEPKPPLISVNTKFACPASCMSTMFRQVIPYKSGC